MQITVINMEKSRWIWYPGEYELYHSIQLHSRREEFGAEYPSLWGLAGLYPRVNFEKHFTFEKDGYIILRANCTAYIQVDGVRHPRNTEIKVKAGEHRFDVITINANGAFPAIYIESDQLVTDGSWMCSPGTSNRDVNAGCEPALYSPTDNVLEFPFEHIEVNPISISTVDNGTLIDFGKELFAKLEFTASEDMTVYYGETKEEALDHPNTLIFESVSAGEHLLVPRAFRYVHFTGKIDNAKAWNELLKVTYHAKFSCDDAEVENILDVCKYTFHLNSREFLLDGIKRDRWCWSGDAYQSYMVNDYLFADRQLNRRTITALYGKPPYLEHINTINDYSALLIIGTWEYYFTSGDFNFIKFIYPRAKALYEFILDRLDENGLVVQRKGDWIFIDWSDIDKDGPLCAEQILLWQAHNAMAKLSEAVGQASPIYSERADKLKALIFEKYWDDEKQAFIDSFTSGRRNVTRHAAIFAILYDFVDRETSEKLLHNVLENDSITKITTPYFKLYELMALCKLGYIEESQRMITSYWGGMVKLGATSIWEEYNPLETGTEHYAMYGSKYGRSLCHAWGSGPVFLLGRYCLGVRPTSIGSKTFVVEPNPGIYKSFNGTVPVGTNDNGEPGHVNVILENEKLTVTADIPGGTLIYKGKEYSLIANIPTVIE